MIYRIEDIMIPKVNIREVCRYAHYDGSSAQTDNIMRKCIDEVSSKVRARVCYRIFSLKPGDGIVMADDIIIPSNDLRKALDGYPYAVLFAATIGLDIDRMISLYARVSPVHELFAEAIGNERIESFCDAFQKQMSDEHNGSGPRFSPGYGDLPLEFQREVFSLLDCQKNAGISLGDNLLMSPVKSVTAFFGINSI